MRLFGVLSVVTGAGLAVAETLLNWGDWQWAPFYVIDFVAAALLIVAGVRTILGRADAVALSCAAWFFSAGMAWMSFFGNIQQACPDHPANCGAYLGLVGGFFAWTVVGSVASAVFAWRSAGRRHQAIR
ncbi:MAG: hypothetical protein AAFZ58_06180 [Pseudomonadota bacterium]